jgi:hypothetical protein
MAPLTFFEDASFQFEAEITLGHVYRRGADAGEVSTAIGAITSGDNESWHRAWSDLAQRVETIAGASAGHGHVVSARDAYLRAAVYYAAATSFLDGTSDPSRLAPTWEAHRRCWDEAVDRFDPLTERLTIPFEQTTLPGYFFRASAERRPVVVLVNGSDGPDTAMWCSYGADAVDRGYHALLVDGPGQQAALFRQQLHFIPDWERVVSPTLDWLAAAPTSTRTASPSSGAVRAATGRRVLPRSSLASPRASPTPACTTASRHGRNIFPPTSSRCSNRATRSSSTT